MSNITRSSNFWGALAAGGAGNWLHVDAGNTGRVTIKPKDNNTCIILCSVTVNNQGNTGSSTNVTASQTGVIASLRGSLNEKDFHYYLHLHQGEQLYIDNTAGMDLTVVYVDY